MLSTHSHRRRESVCKMDVDIAVTQLINYAHARGLIDINDRIWAFNTVHAAMGTPGGEPHFDDPETPFDESRFDLQSTLQVLIAASRETGTGGTALDEELVARIMGALTPRPSVVIKRFYELFEKDPMTACDYLYELSCDVDYVKRAAIARDIKWLSPSDWGELEITINLSKPEKDPRAIAQAARSLARTRYPACQLCIENEAYAGRSSSSPLGSHPARQNLRIIPMGLAGEQWGLQYSPYAYFDEHCIVMSKEHRPMHVDASCFTRLLEFVSRFDEYFIGSNADLPIVGGSILSHDHFQGGKHVFPMMKAPVVQRFTLPDYPQIACGVVKWPVTVLRLTSNNAQELISAATHILKVWRNYSDVNRHIVAYFNGTPHNTITPIARKCGDEYVLDLALRCNLTDEEHPFGIFHPREELHHIKKENIGLIEVMGMAILPPRLRDELDDVANELLNGITDASDDKLGAHAEWAREIAARHPEIGDSCVEEIIRNEVAYVFSQVLEDVGVFKWDEDGRNALTCFLSTL